MTRLGLLTVSAVALVGCAELPGYVPPQPPAGTRFDGLYAGQDILVHGVAFQCGEPTIPTRIEIRDGRFAYPFQVNPPRVAPLPVQAGIDGAVSGQIQFGTSDDIGRGARARTDWAVLRGQITGATFDATVSTMRCLRRLTLQKAVAPGQSGRMP